ncbi:MAG: amidohydrolase [Gammaproteobacteria bacterium]|jgi:predicted TIM-barrel fold metal-dependent hydrolase|nr:amidohydrolase [Dehalococcoidia bacterium]MCH2669813.1 amidohydrolase [Gammaproteobacteria bacterium]|tara:strand:- start:505 stop:1575 length:1071 start_codon:yes stop_codon:yes gene_type:complete
MPESTLRIMDSDGHLIESNEELSKYVDDSIKRVATGQIPAQDGPFPTLDGIHNYFKGKGGSFGGPRHTASDERTGSGEDWSVFLDKTNIEQTVIFPTKGLAVGFIQTPEYATRLCHAYNDYVFDRYRNVDKRIHPMGLIPLQSPKEAAKELRRIVIDLGLPGAMLPSTGLPLGLAHEYYHPVYEEAAGLGCVLAIHGGSNRGIGIDDFTDFIGSHILHHPVPLMYALVSFVYQEVFDKYPDLKVSFLEGGPGWLVPILDRAIRDDEFFGKVASKPFDYYLTNGNVQIGCEGNDASLSYVASRIGIEPFAYSSDYPHEVDLAGAMHEIEETVESTSLSDAQKQAVLHDNTQRFYGFD